MDYPRSQAQALHLNADNQFTDGDIQAGVPASIIPSIWANALTDEMLEVIRQAGFTPNEQNSNQLYQSIRLIAPPPVGVIFPYASNNMPDGYIECSGATISRETYQDLFNVIGTTYGQGDGSTTFNLPNFTNGNIPISTGTTSSGQTLNLGDQTEGELPNVSDSTHQFTTRSTYSDSSGALRTSVQSRVNITSPISNGSGSYSKLSVNLRNANTIYGGQDGSASAVLPKGIACKWIIKY